jgi:2-(1,2-epoxy-1,2-dihydrophenyl)acetyl-CoA isomerase
MSADVPSFETVNLILSPSGVATVELNRPESLNAWNRALGADLLAALRFAGDEPSVRCVLLVGSGRGFSSGADLKDFSADLTPDGRPDVYTTLTNRYHPIMHAIRDLPLPVVAAVAGPAVGIGCSLALCCDLVVAADSAYFLLAFVNIGLVPDGGSSLFVPARVGAARAAELALLGERLSASDALAWGLINRVVPADRLREEASALAERLAAGPTRAYAGAKRLLNARVYADMDSQLELEARLQQEMTSTSDFIEGVTAFAQKRPPAFRGC